MTTVSGSASRCGDLAWVELAVDGGRIVEARGEGESVAELLGSVCGATVLEAAARCGPALATDALAEALAQVARADPSEERVAVAMSGGVDSAVALLRAREIGEVVGVTLRLWVDPAGADTERACCSPSSVLAAREACHRLGVPHFTLDLRKEFRRTVVGPFVRGYTSGETPNPCVRCNGRFRFAELLAFARRIGAARLATGHYARIVEHDNARLLARGVDERKDQSYMLAELPPAVLERLWFPLGERTKDETRAEARAAGLAAAGRPESQEACFLGGDDYRDFLDRHGLSADDGPIVDPDGRPLGTHRGHWRYTPGQRRGLGLADGTVRFVLRTDPATNAVIVGPHELLAARQVTVDRGRLHVHVEHADAKLRYRSPAAPARVEPRGDGFVLNLDRPAFGVAPGQAAVLYQGDVVVGAGTISSAESGG